MKHADLSPRLRPLANQAWTLLGRPRMRPRVVQRWQQQYQALSAAEQGQLRDWLTREVAAGSKVPVDKGMGLLILLASLALALALLGLSPVQQGGLFLGVALPALAVILFGTLDYRHRAGRRQKQLPLLLPRGDQRTG
ncbi:hypothetical protein [Gallaecimonas xiamenensis]|uniref:Uncharacterized protein n=1 Tax=Gallaecimonas xiamenensis 3-C-1 TaxID=745411 RepID=K2JSN3_9GAMM|nr:hypothetical protein [Gallaecimonas xiamenensis]EKE77517.1 hypothetical protein B3C1_01860 [Gallaecimonas xiamenensis 3-C-1]